MHRGEQGGLASSKKGSSPAWVCRREAPQGPPPGLLPHFRRTMPSILEEMRTTDRNRRWLGFLGGPDRNRSGRFSWGSAKRISGDRSRFWVFSVELDDGKSRIWYHVNVLTGTMPSPWARLRVDTDVGKAPTVAYNSCVRIGVIYYTMSYTYPITCLTLPSIHALVVETGSANLQK
jgi:hypothetical protein